MDKKPLKIIFTILMCISMVVAFMPMSIYSWADDTVVSESSSEDVVQEVDSTEKGIERVTVVLRSDPRVVGDAFLEP